MTKSFFRRIIYLTLVAILLVPLYLISHPATTEDAGGTLARMRTANGLSQAELGEIDPASASMNLATLGMRGVAANLLWTQANKYQMKEDYDSLKATLNQITKLQPNFIGVWRFQAWNLSYNVSVEFDDYRHRYHWVKKGIDYLITGTRYNRDEPRLLWDVGWFFGHKFGRSDEYRQFRQLFREDDDFHASLNLPADRIEGPDRRPDNWMVAKYWFDRAQKVVDTKDVSVIGHSPLTFHSWPPKALMSYADAIEEEGYLDEKAQKAWRDAGDLWNVYGSRNIPTSFGYEIRLNDLEKNQEQANDAARQLDALAGGVRDTILAEKRSELTDAQRAALDTPESDRTPEQQELAYEAAPLIKISFQELAERIKNENHDKAVALARQARHRDDRARMIRRYRNIVNFDYWKIRCLSEQELNTIQARKLIYDAHQAYDDARLEDARKMYEASFDLWEGILDRYPRLIDDAEGEDLMEDVNRYRELLSQLDEAFPPSGFKLMKLLEARDPEHEAAASAPTTEEPAPATDESEPAPATDESEPAPATDESEPAPATGEPTNRPR